jgi:tetratricopeptide (TPR) repeat protein
VYRFAHDVLHEVVEFSVSVTRRALLHRRLAVALEQQPGEPQVEALAYHFRRGGDLEKAALYLERAGDRASARHADAAAEASYADLVDLLDSLGREHAAAGAREKLAAVLTRRSRYTEALAVLDRAARVYREESACLDLARVTARQGALHAEMGTTAEGMRLVQPLVARLEPLGPSPELLDLHITMCDLAFHGGEFEPRRITSERAVAVARTLGDDRLLAEAYGIRGVVLLYLYEGRHQEGIALLQEGQHLLEVTGVPVSLGAIRLLVNLADAQFYSGQQRAALRTIDQAVETAEQFGDPRYVAWLAAEHGTMQIYVGDWEGAAQNLERAMALNRQIGLSHGSAGIFHNLGSLRLLQGALDDAARLFEEAKALCEQDGNATWAWRDDWCLADLLHRKGSLHRARDRFLDLVARPEAAYWLCYEPTGVCLARVLLDLGDVDRAAQALADLAALPILMNHVYRQIEIRALQGQVATRQGHWAEAAQCLEEGFTLTRAVTYPYGESQLLRASGLLLAQQDQPDTARAQLEAALAIVTRLGARLDLAAIAADLAALPVPTPTL